VPKTQDTSDTDPIIGEGPGEPNDASPPSGDGKKDTPPPPLGGWFNRLQPATRAILVTLLNALIMIGWSKIGVPVPAPQLPTNPAPQTQSERTVVQQFFLPGAAPASATPITTAATK
jgi:hypothetical protein